MCMCIFIYIYVYIYIYISVPWYNISLSQKALFRGIDVEYFANYNFEDQVQTQDWFDTHISLNEEETS